VQPSLTCNHSRVNGNNSKKFKKSTKFLEPASLQNKIIAGFSFTLKADPSMENYSSPQWFLFANFLTTIPQVYIILLSPSRRKKSKDPKK
jgi:hypothetical protein